jgi:glutamate-5-semialdehyde dehydrogenase
MAPLMTHENLNLLSYMSDIGQRAAHARDVIRLASPEQRRDAVRAMAHEIRSRSEDVLAANVEDMRAAEEKGLSAAMLDRLKLNTERLNAIAGSLDAIAGLPDPIGQSDESWTQPNGLKFEKKRIPIGVIGMIYESRPNVTADAGALCVKSGNGCILRGGSESLKSSSALHSALQAGLVNAGLSADTVQMVATSDRDAVGLLLSGLNGCVDLIIPRGGKNLIARVEQDARVPVLSHLEGLCHSYVHADADIEKAQNIIMNAKLRRTGVCGATETLLVDEAIAPQFLPSMLTRLIDAGCAVKGDIITAGLNKAVTIATPEDYATEHLAAILNIAIVTDIHAAIAHIARFGSGHTDAIITENETAAAKFTHIVDSAIVMHNASTQFADGGEFGFGAEIGIATGRLHARGPVGAQHLTTYKYVVKGTGQTRP